MPGYQWIRCQTEGDFPKDAVESGKDVDGATIYVGRAIHEGNMLPGKVIPSKNIAYVSYGGQELVKDEYEVLIRPKLYWVHSQNGEVPHNAVIGGFDECEDLYVARVHKSSAVAIGKVHPSHGCAYVPFDSKEEKHTEYEVLVCDD